MQTSGIRCRENADVCPVVWGRIWDAERRQRNPPPSSRTSARSERRSGTHNPRERFFGRCLLL